MTLLYLSLFIDAPPVTFPELKSFLLGQKVTEGYSLYSEIIDTTPPLTAWWYGLLQLIFGRSLTAAHIVGFLILILQSAFWGISLINKKAFTENTYLPSFLFSIFAFCALDSFSLTGELPAFGFILLALNQLLKEIEFRIQQEETTFSLGILIGIASLFSFSYIIYLPGFVFILLVFTRNLIRKYLLMSFGFLLPHLIVISFYYYNESLPALWEYYYLGNLRFGSSALLSLKGLFFLSALPVFYLVISFFILSREGRLSKYQSQVFQVMFLWTVIAFVQLFLTENLRPQSLLPLVLPTSFFITHFLLVIRRRKFAELNFWILFLGAITIAYLSRYNKIESIDYSSLFVNTQPSDIKNKRILVLGEDPSLYLENTIAPSFTDWACTKEIFEKPDYYENVLLINHLFEKDVPQVIIDPQNLMAAYFARIPQLGAKYKKNADGYELISN